jgi:hypothetical protein
MHRIKTLEASKTVVDMYKTRVYFRYSRQWELPKPHCYINKTMFHFHIPQTLEATQTLLLCKENHDYSYNPDPGSFQNSTG